MDWVARVAVMAAIPVVGRATAVAVSYDAYNNGLEVTSVAVAAVKPASMAVGSRGAVGRGGFFPTTVNPHLNLIPPPRKMHRRCFWR